MRDLKALKFVSVSCLVLFLASCNKQFKDDNYVAYFGGEVINPTSPYVLFCKDSEVIDTIHLNKDNTFFIKFDSLTPGLYVFKNEPEYQYVYFDKNDSLMVRINAVDFDESIVFCGRGDEKNNFLMDLYLKYERDKMKIYDVYEMEIPRFNKYIDSSYKSKEDFYTKKKEEIKWSDGFDAYAKATLDFNYYAKKEIYPMVHKMRTGNNIKNQLPKDFYDYRNEIDFNDPKFTNFSPFVRYLTYMLNNVASTQEISSDTEIDEALESNIKKLNIADTLFKNEKIKNRMLDNIAFTYLLEDQNIVNNKKFLDRYHLLSTDKSQHNEILKIGNSIQLLKTGNKLPEIDIIDIDGNQLRISDLIKRKTVIFFWTENLESHLIAAHKKIMEMKSRHPSYDFIGVNVDKDQEKWKKEIAKYKFSGINEIRAANFIDLKDKWVINKIHRTMIVNADGTVENAFVSIFDAKFEDNLK